MVKKVKKVKSEKAESLKKKKRVSGTKETPVKKRKIKSPAAEGKVTKKKARKAVKDVTEKRAAKASKAKASTAKSKKAAPTAADYAKPHREKVTKTSIIAELEERFADQDIELSRKEIKAVMETIGDLVVGCVRKKGSGDFNFHGLFKVKVKDVPAKKARKGTNPFTGEPTVFKAKPASRKVKITPLKKLKDAALV